MSKRRNFLHYSLLFILVSLSRIPFISAGYGLDADAWWVANTARDIAITGTYHVSRFPGYPIHEIFNSLIWETGPRGLNGITAIFSGLGIALFAAITKILGTKNSFVITMALAFTPIVYSSSTVALDYMWAFAFAMWAFYLLLINRPGWAGLMLGIAVGCRITSALMLAPLSVIYFSRTGMSPQSLLKVLCFTVVSFLVGVIAFVPVFMTYGLSFLRFVETNRTLIQIVRIATAGVFGRIGTIILLLGIIIAIGIAMRRAILGKSVVPITSLTTAYFLGIAVYLAAYLRLPVEAAYLIPALPFGLLALDTVLPKKVCIVVCIGIIMSSFVSVNSHGLVEGRILEEHRERLLRMQFIESSLSVASNLPQNSLVVAGDWYPMIDNDLFSKPPNVRFVYSLSQGKAEEYLEQDYTIYYYPGQRNLIKLSGEYADRIAPLLTNINIEE